MSLIQLDLGYFGLACDCMVHYGLTWYCFEFQLVVLKMLLSELSLFQACTVKFRPGTGVAGEKRLTQPNLVEL